MVFSKLFFFLCISLTYFFAIFPSLYLWLVPSFLCSDTTSCDDNESAIFLYGTGGEERRKKVGLFCGLVSSMRISEIMQLRSLAGFVVLMAL